MRKQCNRQEPSWRFFFVTRETSKFLKHVEEPVCCWQPWFRSRQRCPNRCAVSRLVIFCLWCIEYYFVDNNIISAFVRHELPRLIPFIMDPKRFFFLTETTAKEVRTGTLLGAFSRLDILPLERCYRTGCSSDHTTFGHHFCWSWFPLERSP